MKRVITLIASTILAFTFTGCNDSTTSSAKVDSGNYGDNIRMQRGVQYVVKKGDEIEKLSDNPNIEIVSNLESGKTVVTLLSGEAAIIKK